MAAVTAAVVVAVVLAVVFARVGGGGSSAEGGEVFLQPTDSAGQDPYTGSTAKQSSALPEPSASDVPPTGAANELRGVEGGAPGLYGGTRQVAACDVEKQIAALGAGPAKSRSFASVAGVQPSGLPAYLRSLTPVQLRVDTRVTNHGYRDGAATSYQAVLQAGTAVLVDGRGVPRVRCACGNPLTPPVAQRAAPRVTGPRWSSYRPSNVVVVTPAPQPVSVFVLYDTQHHDWIHRHRGDHDCRHDEHAKPPVSPHPWNRPEPCPASPGTTGTPGSSPKPCRPTPGESASSSASSSPPGSRTSEPKGPESRSPGSQAPESKTPGSKTAGSKTPGSHQPRTPESTPPSEPASPTPSPGPPSGETPTSTAPATTDSLPGSSPGETASETNERSTETLALPQAQGTGSPTV